MKKIKYYGLILMLSFAGFACSDYLDVRPENQMLLEEFWQEEADVEATVMACYRMMQEDAFMRRVIIWGELRSDNIIAGGGAKDPERQIDLVNILATNENCEWKIFYTIINYCNTILKYAPEVRDRDPNFTFADLQAKESEVLAIRAFCYFYLVRTFRDIPWIEEATVSDEQRLEVPQSPPDVVLERITNDLLHAETWAVTDYVSVREAKGRMGQDAIRALLADIYLWRKNYEKCIEYCDKLINALTVPKNYLGEILETPKYEFIENDMSSYMIFYIKNATESIFELQFTEEKYNDAVSEFYGNASNSKGQFIVTARHMKEVTLFPLIDKRRTHFIDHGVSENSDYTILKYVGYNLFGDISSYSQTTPNWIFYRITDIMLMKAEALAQLNRSEDDLKEALYLVNKTYKRANITLTGSDSLTFEMYGNQAAMEKLVLLERQRELMFEGKRWYDLVRHAERNGSTEVLVDHVLTKYESNVSTISSKLAVINALYFPIHANELKVNPLLEQNPYYKTSSNIEK
ncbi:MAG: RagB/SusD family nutrient uptake outer membrane protein [Dysgonamonadaceae bacterium]|jgi:tetratricopeptide (TPR) repeat protein|nr:RagB/SusD family nutrient uptake outer membrane protein [Dysgonamonadaceae bacterium]